MRFTWLSNAPWAPTGYGNQTALFVPRLIDKGHEIAVLAFYGHDGSPIGWNNVPIYGKAHHPYGQDIMAPHTAHYKTNTVLTLVDAWVIEPQNLYPGQRWLPWFPVDSEPLPRKVAEKVKQAYRRLVFSKFGERMVHDAGMDCAYIPHGVDTEAFQVIGQQEARNILKWPHDRFVVGMVAANKGQPSRKAFFPQIDAFAELHAKHPDTTLYLHTIRGVNGEYGGVNIVEYLDHKGLTWAYTGTKEAAGADVWFCDEYTYLLGYPDQYMATMYNALDVHMLVSMGEGFGIPTIEAQACGCPVIVGDWCASGELCFSGWKIPRKESEPFWTPVEAYQYYPRVGPMADALESAYRLKGNGDYRKRARKGALAYDADKVVEKYWMPVLAEIEQQAGAFAERETA